MMTRCEQLQNLLDDLVVLDCRLRSRPKLGASIYLKEGDVLRCAADTGIVRALELGTSLDLPTTMTGRSLLTRKAFVAPDVAPDPRLPVSGSFFPSELFTSMACIPMPGELEISGVLNFYSSCKLNFEPHLRRMQLLAALLTYVQMHVSRGLGVSSSFSRSVGTVLTEHRKELGLSRADVADLAGTSRLAVSRWEAGTQPPSIGLLRRWCGALGLISEADHGLVTLVDVSTQLLELLRRDPGQLSQISPEQFEQVVAERIERMGYDVKLTGSASSRDGGIDFVAVPKQRTLGTFLLAGQCKHHRTSLKTGREAVDRLLAWKDGPFRFGLLVTNTNFTRDALWAASADRNKNFLLLRDFEDLKRWLQGNFWEKEEWREVPDEVTLAPGVVIPVPKPTFAAVRRLWPLETVMSKGQFE